MEERIELQRGESHGSIECCGWEEKEEYLPGDLVGILAYNSKGNLQAYLYIFSKICIRCERKKDIADILLIL